MFTKRIALGYWSSVCILFVMSVIATAIMATAIGVCYLAGAMR